MPPEQSSPGRVIDPEQEAVMADSVGLALLVVLETLAPAERVAFVLHDLFDVPFDEIAPIVGRSPSGASARQPRTPSGQGQRGPGRRPRRRSARSSRPSSRPLAAATSRRCWRCLTRTSCCAPTSVRRADRARSAGARAVAGQALFYSRMGLDMRPALDQRRRRRRRDPGRRAVLGRSGHGPGREDRRDGLPRRPGAAPRARPDDPRRLDRAGPRSAQPPRAAPRR